MGDIIITYINIMVNLETIMTDLAADVAVLLQEKGKQTVLRLFLHIHTQYTHKQQTGQYSAWCIPPVS